MPYLVKYSNFDINIKAIDFIVTGGIIITELIFKGYGYEKNTFNSYGWNDMFIRKL